MKRLHGMGAYLLDCKAIKDHLSHQLLGRLFSIRESRNLFSHESGIFCQASKGLEFCLIGFELLDAVSPPKFVAFVSCRMSECMAEVRSLQTALEAKGVQVIVRRRLTAGSDTKITSSSGGDLLQAVTQGMEAADLFIVMGTETYGRQSDGVINTYQEMMYIKASNKPFVLFNMNPEDSIMRFHEGAANIVFNLSIVPWERWAVGQQMSPMAIDKILQKLDGSLDDSLAVSEGGGRGPQGLIEVGF
jgi:hypothetical protein